MVNPTRTDPGSEIPSSEGIPVAESSLPANIEAHQTEARAAASEVLTPRQRKLAELDARRREHIESDRGAEKLSDYDLDLNFLWQLNGEGLPLTRKDLNHATGNQAVVLRFEDFETLGSIDFIHSSGERMVIEAESLSPDDVLILYPEELGDEEGGR